MLLKRTRDDCVDIVVSATYAQRKRVYAYWRMRGTRWKSKDDNVAGRRLDWLTGSKNRWAQGVPDDEPREVPVATKTCFRTSVALELFSPAARREL